MQLKSITKKNCLIVTLTKFGFTRVDNLDDGDDDDSFIYSRWKIFRRNI